MFATSKDSGVCLALCRFLLCAALGIWMLAPARLAAEPMLLDWEELLPEGEEERIMEQYDRIIE
ncbi:MAG: hypothetical protein RLN70_03320 [Rhodospirillaceae bacterium]